MLLRVSAGSGLYSLWLQTSFNPQEGLGTDGELFR
jgi:hypothetical protein